MRYAIIAAGEGSRLASEGVKDPKPLIEVNSEPLLGRLLRVFMDHDASSISVICNDAMPAVNHYLEEVKASGLHGRMIPLDFKVKSTPSSMHSFYELSSTFGDAEPFILTTVDTIFREDEFGKYIADFQRTVSEGYDGLMGVTDFIDDEKPLYVQTDADLMITGFVDCDYEGSRYISGGIYGLTPNALPVLQKCMERGESRMRNFQRALIADGKKLQAWPFSKVLDIDHKVDIAKAEAFLNEQVDL
jgi:NDP-sugar pyrophosphorylase family protein